ncbi:MAG: hypothetical protein LDL41_12990, partial [Coleofasciculus sp. S288]|nr:hypothetical protein [Coleofasciculus sp. S288]
MSSYQEMAGQEVVLDMNTGDRIPGHAISEGTMLALGNYAPYTWELIRNFQGGNALFTFSNTLIKCGKEQQKVMY